MQKVIHPHKIQDDEQENNKDYGVHRPILPLLPLCPIPFPFLLGLLACVLVAYGDLICQLLQSFGLGVYSTNTMFLTIFLAGEAGGIIVALAVEAATVVAVPTALGPFLFLYTFLYSASSSTEIKSLQSE